MLDGAHHPSDRAPPPVPGVLTHYRPSMSVFAHTAEERPAAGEAGDVEDDVSSFWAPPNSHCCPAPRPLHLREQMVCSGLRKRDRHPPVWKSQSRTMLGGCTWAEASSVSFPSRARAETWRRIIKREYMACRFTSPYPGPRGMYLVCVAKEKSLLSGINL